MHKLLSVTAVLLTLPLPAAAATTFINEIHYDNAGGDVGEGVEIAGRAGTDLDGWSLLFYNGSNGTIYQSATLDGVLDDQQGGFGTRFFEVPGLQNGAPEGIALVDAVGDVVQFLSYEGSFVAAEGAAAGLASADIGVAEPADTPPGFSLQLTGTGLRYGDFVWSPPAASSYAAINAGQTFAPVPLPASLPLLLGGLALVALARRPAA